MQNALDEKSRFIMEYRIRHADGPIKWVWEQGNGLFSTSGELLCLEGVIVDITERKSNETALQQMQKEWRDIFEAIGHPTMILDRDHHILEANEATLKATGKTRDELRKLKCYQVLHGQDDASAAKGCPMETLLKDGRAVTVEMEQEMLGKTSLVSCTPVVDESGTVQKIIHISTDITERKQAEEKLNRSLKEKNVLLKEVHHRVKNNLQIVQSLLNLQSMQIDDAKALSAFQATRNRINSIALVHERMYQSDNFVEINFKDYAQKIIYELYRSYEITGGIQLILDVDEVMLTIESAIPCGLIITELITNAMKYAFQNTSAGKITVRLKKKKDNSVHLTVMDNGAGLPGSIRPHESRTMGFTLVRILSEQLNAEFDYKVNGGTVFTISFHPPA